MCKNINSNNNYYSIGRKTAWPCGILKSFSAFLATLLLLFVLPHFTVAQSQSALNGQTPAGIAPGRPAGSYSLGQVESLNLFSGRVNTTIPLINFGGRGNAGGGLSVTADQSSWFIKTEPAQSSFVGMEFYALDSRTDGTGAGPWTVAPTIGAGFLTMRTVRSDLIDLPAQPGFDFWGTGAITIAYVSSDGSEHTLYDIEYGGAASWWNPSTEQHQPDLFRGTIFTARDGSGLSFICDEEQVINTLYQESGTLAEPAIETYPNGYLKTKDGNYIRFEGGVPLWIKDRNGNKTVFSYETSYFPARLTGITDSNNRQTTISYDSTHTYIGYKGAGGVSRTITLTYGALGNNLRSDQTLATSRGALFPTNSGAGSPRPFDNSNWTYNPTVLSSVTLPDSRQYKLYYNSYGEVARVETPLGGAAEYDYGKGVSGAFDSGQLGANPNRPSINPYIAVYRRVRERREYANGGSTVTGRTTYSMFDQTNERVDVEQKNAAGSSTLAKSYHYFVGTPTEDLFPGGAILGYPAEPTKGREEKTENLDVNNSAVLQRTQNEWSCPSSPCVWNSPNLTQVTTSIYEASTGDFKVAKKEFVYDQYDNLTDTYDYDFGTNTPGTTLLRRSHTDYVTSSTYTNPDVGPHIRNLPSQSWVSSDSAGTNKKSLTVFEYDNYTADSNHAGLVGRSSVSGFDTNYGTSYPVRGNATAVTNYVNAAASSGAITAYLQFDILGNLVKSIDANGNVSTISYNDNFGSPDSEAITNSAPSQLGGLNTYAYPTSVTNQLSWTAYLQYDYFLGADVNTQDINGLVSKTIYGDAFDRPTQTVSAIGAQEKQATIDYDDSNREIKLTSDFNTLNDNLLKSVSFYDGLGRTTETRTYEADGNYKTVQTQYDALGRGYKVSNPFRPTEIDSSHPILWTENRFDSLGRVYETETPDGAKVKRSYDANRTLVVDQAGKQRISKFNGLGELKDV